MCANGTSHSISGSLPGPCSQSSSAEGRTELEEPRMISARSKNRAATPSDRTVDPTDRRGASDPLYREVSRARRYRHSLAVLAIEPAPLPGCGAFEFTGAVGRIAELLRDSTRNSDLVDERADHVVVTFPESEAGNCSRLVARLEDLARGRLGVGLRIGCAFFPEQALTCEALLERAHAELERQPSVPIGVPIRAADAAVGDAGEGHDAVARDPRRVACIMSRFPKLTETFVLNEILALEQCGIDVRLYPLQRGRETIRPPEAEGLVRRAHYTPLISFGIAWANLRSLVLQPRAWLGALAVALRANLGSARYLAGAIAFFPKAVYLAHELARRGVHHVHAHFASHPALVAFVVRRISGIPYSFVAHGSDLHRDQHMLREKLLEAEFAVAISEYNRERMLDCGGESCRDRVVVIHCGVDTAVFH